MTKVDRFSRSGLVVDRIRSHEGPTLRLAALYRGCSRIFTSDQQLIKWLGWTDDCEFGLALREWLDNPPWIA